MDVYRNVEGLTADAVADAHRQDLKVQDKVEMKKIKLMLVVTMLAVMVAGAAPAFAQQEAAEEIAVTGVVEDAPDKADGTTTYGITDESSITGTAPPKGYILEGDYSTYVGQRITVYGIPRSRDEGFGGDLDRVVSASKLASRNFTSPSSRAGAQKSCSFPCYDLKNVRYQLTLRPAGGSKPLKVVASNSLQYGLMSSEQVFVHGKTRNEHLHDGDVEGRSAEDDAQYVLMPSTLEAVEHLAIIFG
jgi:hypothetical protein